MFLWASAGLQPTWMNSVSDLLQNSRRWFCPEWSVHISPLSCTQISFQFSSLATLYTGLFPPGVPLVNRVHTRRRILYTLQRFYLIFEYVEGRTWALTKCKTTWKLFKWINKWIKIFQVLSVLFSLLLLNIGPEITPIRMRQWGLINVYGK